MTNYTRCREEMVQKQLIRRGITDENVLAAMRAVPRHLFVPDVLRSEAYADYPLPLGYGQTISQPYIVALMTESLQLKPGQRVLEVGTGCGYQTAVLAEMNVDVFSVEIVPALANLAAEHLQAFAYEQVFLKAGDGLTAWQEQAPFDRIIVAAAPPALPMGLLEQLRNGGIMVIPVGSFSQQLLRVCRFSAQKVQQEILCAVRFVPLVGSTIDETASLDWRSGKKGFI